MPAGGVVRVPSGKKKCRDPGACSNRARDTTRRTRICKVRGVRNATPAACLRRESPM